MAVPIYMFSLLFVGLDKIQNTNVGTLCQMIISLGNFLMIKIGHCLDLTYIQSANLKFLSNPESKKENGKVMKQKTLNTHTNSLVTFP